MAFVSTIGYERRRPLQTSLYKLVQQNFLTFAATMDAAERPLPKYVIGEFERYLGCGILARGFARTECPQCGHTRLVAFVRKSRSFCPSCLGRTMNAGIQRASSHLALNPHFHCIVTDGVYCRNDEGSAFVFRALPAPSRAEITAVAWQTCEKVCELLRKRGLWLDADPSDDPFGARDPGLAACASTSIRGVLLLGERSGRRLLRLFGEAAYGEGQQEETTSEVTVPGYGFNVHAQTRISGHDRKAERGCAGISADLPWRRTVWKFSQMAMFTSDSSVGGRTVPLQWFSSP